MGSLGHGKELYLKLRDSAGRVAEATGAPEVEVPSGATLLFLILSMNIQN